MKVEIAKLNLPSSQGPLVARSRPCRPGFSMSGMGWRADFRAARSGCRSAVRKTLVFGTGSGLYGNHIFSVYPPQTLIPRARNSARITLKPRLYGKGLLSVQAAMRGTGPHAPFILGLRHWHLRGIITPCVRGNFPESLILKFPPKIFARAQLSSRSS